MDVLYYSSFCKHSQTVVQYIVKNNLIDKISCICIDKRKRDKNGNNILIPLENGRTIMLPPNVQSVPALLRVKKGHTILLGDSQIIQYLGEQYENPQVKNSAILQQNGEPDGFMFQSSYNSSNITSEKYTNYHLTPEELSAEANSKARNLYNYVPASHEMPSIQAPPDTYKPDKVPNGISLEDIEQRRNNEISMGAGGPGAVAGPTGNVPVGGFVRGL